MAEIISNNILLIQSIVGSLIVFLIVTLFRIYFNNLIKKSPSSIGSGMN